MSTEFEAMRIENVPLDKIEINSWNANEMDDETFTRLVEELSTVGMIDPIQVVAMDDGTYRILGGEHRFRAALHLEWDALPCVVLSDAKWRDTDLQKFVTVRLNSLRGKLNPEKFMKIYQEMAEKYGEDVLQKMFAYTDTQAWGKLVNSIQSGLDAALPEGAGKKFRDKAKDAETVEGLGKVLNDIFDQFGDTLDQGYMVFVHGGKPHLYVEMDDSTKGLVDRLIAKVEDSGENINEILLPMIGAALEDPDGEE